MQLDSGTKENLNIVKNMSNRKLKRSHKNLYVLEAGFIFCKRKGLEYSDDKFIDEMFMTEDFDSSTGSEFDNICKDLRQYRYSESYILKEITEDEYEMCIDEFGE